MQALIPILIKYWKEILIGLLLLITCASWYHDRSSIIKAFDTASARYEQELSILEESHEREKQEKKILAEEYKKKLQDLQIDFEKTKEEIETLKSKRIKEITTLRTTDPDTVARQIEEAFGFDYVE